MLEDTVIAPSPVKLRSQLHQKLLRGTPLIKVKKWRDGYVLSTYPPRQSSPFLTEWKICVGEIQRRLRELSITELVEAFRERFGYRPKIRVRVYDNNVLVGDVVFTDPEKAEEFVSKTVMAGGDCKVLFGVRIRGREVWLPRTALTMMLMKGAVVSPWFIFPGYRPPNWFTQMIFSRGPADALLLYGIYIGCLAPERSRREVFERFLNYAKFSNSRELRELAEKLEYMYVYQYGKKRAPPASLWVPYLIRAFVEIAQKTNMFRTVKLEWTPRHEAELMRALSLFPKGQVRDEDIYALWSAFAGTKEEKLAVPHVAPSAPAPTRVERSIFEELTEKTKPTVTMREALEELLGPRHPSITMREALDELLGLKR